MSLRGLVVGAVVVVAAMASAFCQDGERKQAQSIDISVEDADLRDVMDEIGRRVGTNIIVDPGVHEKVTISLRHAPWRDAVTIIAKLAKCSVVARGAILVVKRFEHSLECATCGDALCAACRAKIASGEAFFVPLAGLKDSEGAVADRLEGREALAGLTGYRVSAKLGGVYLVVAPGRTVEVSAIDEALKDTPVRVDDAAPIQAQLTLLVRAPADGAAQKAIGAALASFKDAKVAETATFRVELASGATRTALREALAGSKLELVDVALTGR